MWRVLIAIYCANNIVVLKNTEDYNFAMSTLVLGQMEQTHSYLVVPDLPGNDALGLQDCFYLLQE